MCSVTNTIITLNSTFQAVRPRLWRKILDQVFSTTKTFFYTGEKDESLLQLPWASQ